MDILLFTDSTTTEKHFAGLNRSRTVNLTIHPKKKLKSVVKNIQQPSMVYLDVDSMDETEIKKITTTLANKPEVRYGIVDYSGVIHDPATLFHRNAVDYLNKAVLKEGLSAHRVKAAIRIKPFDDQLQTAATTHLSVDKRDWKLAEKGWKGVKSGQEYTFSMLFIEIDMASEWTQKSGKAHLDEVMNIFHNHVESIFSPLDGKIWMWMNQSGLVLFPFDGKRIDAILSCIRLVLNRTIISAEDYPYNTVITYRMILHLGNTVYRSRGKTGTIVSDTINFLFHMGKQFAQRGHFYITSPVVPFIPDGLKKDFIPAGTFEGVTISKMRLPKE